MGSIISAHCDCGYVVEMPLGGGMRNFNECSNFPFFCEECRIPFIENLFAERYSCPECKGTKVFAYGDKKSCLKKGKVIFSESANNRKFVLTDGKYICPDCGNSTLTFKDAGCWD